MLRTINETKKNDLIEGARQKWVNATADVACARDLLKLEANKLDDKVEISLFWYNCILEHLNDANKNLNEQLERLCELRML